MHYRAEDEEEEHKRSLQLYVFVAKCIAYHFNAKQPTDMARRQLKVGAERETNLAKIVDFFTGYETRIGADQGPVPRVPQGGHANSGWCHFIFF